MNKFIHFGKTEVNGKSIPCIYKNSDSISNILEKNKDNNEICVLVGGCTGEDLKMLRKKSETFENCQVHFEYTNKKLDFKTLYETIYHSKIVGVYNGNMKMKNIEELNSFEKFCQVVDGMSQNDYLDYP